MHQGQRGGKFWVKVLTELRDGFERGDTLLHRGTASLTTEPDRFLLGELRSWAGLAGGIRDAVRPLRRKQTAKKSGTGPLRTAARRTRLDRSP